LSKRRSRGVETATHEVRTPVRLAGGPTPRHPGEGRDPRHPYRGPGPGFPPSSWLPRPDRTL